MIRRWRGVLVSVLAVLATLAIATSSAAAPGMPVPQYASEHVSENGSREVVEEEHIDPEDQARIDLIYPFIQEIADFDGYEESELGDAVNEVTVYWSAGDGSDLQTVYDLAAAAGIDVNVAETAYSEDEIWELASTVLTALDEASIDVEGVSIGSPYTTVEFRGAEISRSSALQEQALRIAYSILSDDVTVTFGEPSTRMPMDSRHADGGQPTPGGAFTNTWGACTSGMGWVHPGFRFYMLSAAHCVNFANNNSVSFKGNPYNAGTYSGYIGTLVGNPNNQTTSQRLLDATLIGVPATPSIAGEMFVGNFTSATKVDINAWAVMPSAGTSLCTSGSSTGTRCSVKVTNTTIDRDVMCAGGGNCRWTDARIVNTTGGAVLMGRGDSGGPVYVLSGGRRTIVAIMSAGALPVSACGSNSYYSGAMCSYNRGFVTPISWIRTELLGEQPVLTMRLRP